MKSVLALVPAAIVAGTLMNVPAEARCEDHAACVAQRQEARTKTAAAKMTKAKTVDVENTKARAATVKPRHVARHTAKIRKLKAVASRRASNKLKNVATKRVSKKLNTVATKRVSKTGRAFAFAPPTTETGDHVVGLIKSMSPSYGVPTWFALRIAKIESNYNPRVRGRAGEYGVYQIKCATARGLGFSGDCSQLSDARTNVQWGLKHLAEALELSSGNLKLAASKHNAGLGRRTIVPHYVNMVF